MKHLPAPCAGQCGRPVRPQGTNRDEWGGALIVKAKGMCNTCYMAAPREYMKIKGVHVTCLGCERPFRERHTTVEEHPGTIAHYTAGRCKSCHNLHTGKTKLQHDRRPEKCRGCNERMRPKLRSYHEFPGTVSHNGRGYCNTCKSRVDRGLDPVPVGKLPVKVTTPTPRTEFVEFTTDMGLNRMMQERAARKAKQERAQRIQVEQEAVQRRFIQSRRAA